MAVPDTNTFSLQDVVDEINPSSNDLVQCVNDATTQFYDGRYFKAPATSLLEFRNYVEGVFLPSYSIKFDDTIVKACSNTASLTTIYQNSGGVFNFNDPIYANALGTVFASEGYWSNNNLVRRWSGTAWESFSASSCPL